MEEKQAAITDISLTKRTSSSLFSGKMVYPQLYTS